jgi:glycosyltransferase involved in cell wall biosynthesis
MKSKNIAWIVSRLDIVGGGEKLLGEGVRHYSNLGHKVFVYTWAYNSRSTYDGKYSFGELTVFEKVETSRQNLMRHALARAIHIFKIRKSLKDRNINTVICQSEYDAILVRVASIGLGIKTVLLAFGQTFQFINDLAKYSFTFRKAFRKVFDLNPVYRGFIPEKAPRTTFSNAVFNELICFVRYHCVRKMDRIFVLSNQNKDEINFLYGVEPTVIRAAFNLEDLNYSTDKHLVREKYGINPDVLLYCSICRLEKKKRVDVLIKAFNEASLPNAILVIGGVGEESNMLTRLITELGNPNIIMLGFVPELDVRAIKYASDIYVSLDVANWGIAAVESLALGCKSIYARDIDLSNDIKMHSSIFLTDPTISAVSEAMVNAAQFKAHSRINRELLLQHTWEHYFDSILS